MFTSRSSVHGLSIDLVPLRQGHLRQDISIVVLVTLSVADGKIIRLMASAHLAKSPSIAELTAIAVEDDL